MNKFLKLIILSTSIMSGGVLALELIPRYVMSTELAESLAKDAIAECKKSNANISVSVVNDQGKLVYFYRGEETGPNTVRTSFRKAYTAATIKFPTSVLGTFVDNPGFSQLGKMEDDILMLAGGLPLRYKGLIIGGIGMSGSPDSALEEKCGQIAIESVFKNVSG